MCHNNKDGRVQRILGNSYGQPIIGDIWNSVASYHFCNRDHKHPEYGRVLTGDSNGKLVTDELALYCLGLNFNTQWQSVRLILIFVKIFVIELLFSFLYAADKRQELFCHEPLTGDLLRSDVNSNGEFQAEQTVKTDFCQVSIKANDKRFGDERLR